MLMRIAIGMVLLIGILAAFFIYSLNGTEGFRFFGEGGPEPRPSLPVWEVALSGLAMLLGLCFGVLSEHLKQRTGNTNFLKEIRGAFTSAAFFRALLASPILFSGVYVAANKQPDAVIALIFAFENGFFCNAILHERRRLP